jgi:hypothetical protein
LKLERPFCIRLAPVAPGLSRSETHREAGLVVRAAHAVDPAEAQRFVQGFAIRDAAMTVPSPVASHYEIRGRFVALLKPGAKRGGIPERT